MVSLKDYQLNSQDFYRPMSIDSAVPAQTGIDAGASVGQTASSSSSGSDRRLIDTLTKYNNTKIGAYTSMFKSEKIDLSKVYDFDAELIKLNGADSSGPWADPKKLAGALGSAGLGIGFAGQNLGSTLGIGAILNAKEGVVNPVTGEKTLSLIPFLDNLVMKERYNAMSEIQNYINGGSKGGFSYDIFRLGTQTFIRKPGEYRFIGNVGALGIDHGDLHKIVAVSQGQDPRDYDYKTGKSSRSDILTYGNGLAGGYTLDGGHVDNRGIFASAGGGHSAEFAEMAYKYFNGEKLGVDGAKKIAQAWLTSTANLRKSSFFGGQSYNATEQAALKANFDKFVAMSKGTFQSATPSESGYPLANQPVTSSTFDQGAADSITDAQSEDYNEAVVNAGYDFGAFDTYNDESQGRRQFLSALQTGTGDPEPSSFVKDFTDPPNYQRYTGGDPTYGQPPPKNTTPKGTIPKSFGGGGRFDELGPHPDRFDFLNNDMPIHNFAGGLDKTTYDVVRDYIANGYNKIASKLPTSLNAFTLPIMAVKEADKAGLGAGLLGVATSPTEKNKFNEYFNLGSSSDDNNDNEDKEVTEFDSSFRPTASITRDQADQIREANKEAGFTSNLRGGFKQGGYIPMQEGGQPQLVGGVMPQQVSEQATVADDQPRQVPEKSFVVNAPTVEKIILNPDAINVAGVQDVRKMVVDAYTFAKQKGMSIGNVDRGLYEESVDVALSKGELVIPPDLVKVIGKDRLEKINNRGKKEVTRRAKASGQENSQGLQLGDFVEGAVEKTGDFLGNVFQNLMPNTLQNFTSDKPKPSLKISDDDNFLNLPPPAKGGQPKVVIQGEGFAPPSLKKYPDSTQDIPYYDLFESLEDNRGAGYVPEKPDGTPFENSGVTIGVGVDLSKQTAKRLLQFGVDASVVEKLKPYIGEEKTGQKAESLLDKQQLTLDTDEIAHLNNRVVRGYLKNFEKDYPEFKDINDRDKGFMLAAYYHGSLKNYKKFRRRYLETQSIPTALKTGLYNLISKDGSDRNRADKALTWWNSQSEIPETPLSKPKM